MYEGNYRPVSILPSCSKIFERLLYDQLYLFFEQILSALLAAFRKKFSCEHVLIKLVEDCKAALDHGGHVGMILMDLSKAFDGLPHKLMLRKIHTYGVSISSCALLHSYLVNRKQRVKLGSCKSEWASITKGVPQGSILGPLLFNIFMNDMLYFLEVSCSVSNYADDNTLRYAHSEYTVLKHVLESSSTKAVAWFDDNSMKANPSKFQSLVFKDSSSIPFDSFEISGQDIAISDCVKLLGIFIDNKLNFDHHIRMICAKASRQINAILRIGKYLDISSKLNLYNAFVVSNFSFCSIVWNFCTKHSIFKIEKVNKRALRAVFNDYTSSYSDLLKKVNRPCMYVLRMRKIAIEVYRCTHELNPSFMHSIFQVKESNYDLRDANNLHLPKVKTVRNGLDSFSYHGAKIWNMLPDSIKSSKSLPIFKAMIDQWQGPSCTCNSCVLCKIKLL